MFKCFGRRTSAELRKLISPNQGSTEFYLGALWLKPAKFGTHTDEHYVSPFKRSTKHTNEITHDVVKGFDESLSSPQISQPNGFQNFLDKYISQMDLIHFSTVFHRIRKHNISLNDNQLRQITKKLETLQTHELEAGGIASILYGFRTLRSENPNVRRLYSVTTSIMKNAAGSLRSDQFTQIITGLINVPGGQVESKAFISSVAKFLKKHCNAALQPHQVGIILSSFSLFDSRQAEVQELLDSCLEAMNRDHSPLPSEFLAKAISGLKHMNSQTPQVQSILKILVDRANDFEPFTSQDIGLALSGLKSMDCRDTLVQSLLLKLVPLIKNSKETLQPKHLALAFSNFSSMESNTEAVLDLLVAISSLIDLEGPSPLPKEVAMILFGLKGLRSDVEEVRTLVLGLSTLVARCEEGFNSRELGMALSGLKWMSTEHSEVRSLLSHITRLVRSGSGPLIPQSISMGFAGLRSMDSRREETQDLLSALLDRLEATKGPLVLDPIQISMVMSGLVNLHSETPQVRRLLPSLTRIISSSHLPGKSIFDQTAFRTVLLGLRGMSSEDPEVRSLLQSLTPYFEARTSLKPQFYVNSSAISTGLSGLRGLKSSHPEVRRLLQALNQDLSRTSSNIKRHSSSELFDRLCFLSEDISDLFSGLREMSSDHKEVREILSHFKVFLSALKAPYLSTNNFALILPSISNLRFDVSESSELLTALTRLLPTSKKTSKHPVSSPLSSEELAMCLYGMRGMNSDSKIVSEFIRQFVSLVREHPDTSSLSFTSFHSIALALSGLKGLRSQDSSTESLLHVLLPLLQSSLPSLNPHEICPEHLSLALSGLEHMNPNHPHTKIIVQLLVSLLSSHHPEPSSPTASFFSCSQLASALSGLKQILSKSDEARNSLLPCLLPFISASALEQTRDVPALETSLQVISSLSPSEYQSRLFSAVQSALPLPLNQPLQTQSSPSPSPPPPIQYSSSS